MMLELHIHYFQCIKSYLILNLLIWILLERKCSVIISCSRRTDIPAFYKDYFVNSLQSGYFNVFNPVSKTFRKIIINHENIDAFVFWSKDYTNFIDVLDYLDANNYKFYLNYTVNNYPCELEQLKHPVSEIVSNCIDLSERYTVYWRYDPIYISETTDISFHLKNFARLCEQFEKNVNRVIINLLQEYPFVIKRLRGLSNEFQPKPLSDDELIDFCIKIKEIANKSGQIVYSCTPLFNQSMILNQSHCIDRETITTITGKKLNVKVRPVYNGCGCYESIDIGDYRECHHNCVYCYANKRSFNLP